MVSGRNQPRGDASGYSAPFSWASSGSSRGQRLQAARHGAAEANLGLLLLQLGRLRPHEALRIGVACCPYQRWTWMDNRYSTVYLEEWR